MNDAMRARLLGLAGEQSLEHAIILLDPSGAIAWWSPGAERILGHGREEILGERLARIFVPEDVEKGLDKHEMAVAIEVGSAEDDRWQLRKDGSRFWATGALVTLREADGSIAGFAKILRNRTDVKEQIEALRNRAEALAQEAARKDLFLSTLSHELRNPLAPLTNAVRIIRMAATPTREVEYGLTVIERQMALLQRLVDDLLDLTRITSGKVDLKRRRVPVGDLVERAVEVTAPLVAERRHRLEVILPAAPLEVDVDPERMVQVFVNLLANAAKYTLPGGHISVKATEEGGEVVTRFEDDGVGIPTDMLPRIFDLFTQVESSLGLARGGLGIGLALVKDLVALHGGSVQVLSDGPGKGSKFAVRLPAQGVRHEA